MEIAVETIADLHNFMEDFEKMKKNIRNILFLGLALILSQNAYAGSKKEASRTGSPKDSLVISVGSVLFSEPLDPIRGSLQGLNLFHSALLKITNDLEAAPDLAAGYTISDDRLVYTFTLRTGVKFSDGTLLKPEDVVFTYLTAKNSGSEVDLTMLETAEVLDGAVRFTLNRVFSPFIRLTALLGIVPQQGYNENYGRNPIGTGPFKVKQFDVNQQIILENNPYYYGTKSPFKQITILNVNEETALAAAKSGQLDVVMVNPEYAKEKVANMTLRRFKTVDNRGFNLPVTGEQRNSAGNIVGNNITADPALRKALNIGINRREIINNALNGIGAPSVTRFQGTPWNQGEPVFQDGQAEEAKKILEAAGWVDTDGDGVREKNGVRCEFRIQAPASELERYNLAAALAENARPLGVTIIPAAVDWDTIMKTMRGIPSCIATGSYNFDVVWQSFHTRFADPDDTGWYNLSSYRDPAVDEYLEKMLAAGSDADAIAQAKKAQYDGAAGPNVDIPFLVIVNIEHAYFIRDGLSVGNQRVHPHGHGVPVIQNLNEWRFE
jgi:peptide/nickel transport system substrate-binding protein